jgi:opacity protein-like surface antigen
MAKYSPAIRIPRQAAVVATLIAGASLAAAPGALAQGPTGGDGFLFDRPSVALTLRAGFAWPNARSDIFSFTTDLLTLRRKDFNAFDFGADLAFWITPVLDIVVTAEHAGAGEDSEFRDWFENGAPIEQRTRFSRTPLTVGMKAYLLPRGTSIGRFAWVPARFTPYVGVGGGALYYAFTQAGDFVDLTDPDDPEPPIFTDRFESSGWTPTVHGMAGMDWSISPSVAITVEGRYGWAEAEMSRDFVDFDRIDLSGFNATLGLTFRY